MKAIELQGYYGSNKTPDTIYYYDGWYCVDGSANVNRTYEEVNEGVWIEELTDYDCFTWSKPIESIEEFMEAIEN